jgi:hypothetical protein
MQPQPRGGERWPAVIGEGAADRGAVAAHRLGFRIVASFDRALDRPDATHLLLQYRLGVAVGFEDRQGGLAQIQS